MIIHSTVYGNAILIISSLTALCNLDSITTSVLDAINLFAHLVSILLSNFDKNRLECKVRCVFVFEYTALCIIIAKLNKISP